MAEWAPFELQSAKNRRLLQCQSGSHKQIQGPSRHIRPWKDLQGRVDREFCALSVPILCPRSERRFDPVAGHHDHYTPLYTPPDVLLLKLHRDYPSGKDCGSPSHCNPLEIDHSSLSPHFTNCSEVVHRSHLELLSLLVSLKHLWLAI